MRGITAPDSRRSRTAGHNPGTAAISRAGTPTNVPGSGGPGFGPRGVRQSLHDLRKDGPGPLLDLGRKLVLDGMRHVDRVIVRPAQRRCLGPGGGSKHVRRHGDCGNARVLNSNRVVQTARRARPSIGQGLDDRVRLRLPNVGQDRFRRRLGERGLGVSEHLCNAMSCLQQRFQAVQKDRAAGLADVKQSNAGTLQCREPRRN